MFAQARRNVEGRPWIELLSPMTQLGSTGRQRPSLVGEELFGFLEKIRTAPLSGSMLSSLPEDRLRWRDGGAMLWHASVLLHQGREAAANELAGQAFELFPEELRMALNGQ